jgi:hypothetical protein
VTGIPIEVRRAPPRTVRRSAHQWGEPADIPWRVGDLLSVVLVNTIGFILILVGWYVAHNTTEPTRHVLATNIAVGGLVLANVAHVVWVLSGLREVGQLRRHLLDTHAALNAARNAPATTAALDAGDLVATVEMTRYHRPTCPAVRGKPVRALSAQAHADKGRRPCGICQPDWRAELLVK